MRAVRDAGGVDADRCTAEFLPSAEIRIAAHVERHFVRLGVAVHVRHLDRVADDVQLPRRERADDEAVALERLMNRRRLMDRAGERLEILRVERERINDPVPADDVERMLREDVCVRRRAVLR